jgi:hypothetical protein
LARLVWRPLPLVHGGGSGWGIRFECLCKCALRKQKPEKKTRVSIETRNSLITFSQPLGSETCEQKARISIKTRNSLITFNQSPDSET